VAEEDKITPVDVYQRERPARSSDGRSEEAEAASSGAAVQPASSSDSDPADPMGIGRHRRDNVTRRQMKIDHPKGDKKKLKKFYTRQNELIEEFLGAGDEERLAVEDDIKNGPKVKFAVHASFVVNFFLFVIQMYAAISTGSLSVSRAVGRGGRKAAI